MLLVNEFINRKLLYQNSDACLIQIGSRSYSLILYNTDPKYKIVVDEKSVTLFKEGKVIFKEEIDSNEDVIKGSKVDGDKKGKKGTYDVSGRKLKNSLHSKKGVYFNFFDTEKGKRVIILE